MINISKKVEYGVVLVKYLSVNKDKNVSLGEIAERLNLPPRFLSQIAVGLKKGKILKSHEGKKGGYILEKNWEKKSIYDLIVALGEDKKMVECLGEKKCRRSNICKLRSFWEKIDKKWYLELKKVKLKEI
ncbi:MAG: Rrf2 family transcriptional regulator [Candidatus Shapirobacteria bacterium]|nr:Rrf2 family transcriptional regulator [Candidatus Woesebacteria bacterium]